MSTAIETIENTRFNSITPTCFTKYDAEDYSPDCRTVVISDLSSNVNIKDIISRIDEVSTVLSAEYVMRYEHPELIQTDDLLATLRDPEFLLNLPTYLTGREVQIHEHSSDNIAVIYLDNSFRPTKTENYSRKSRVKQIFCIEQLFPSCTQQTTTLKILLIQVLQ